MKLYKTLIVLVLCAVALVGCSSSEGITKKDLGIVKVDNKDDVIQYGMSRSDAEKILGKGQILGESSFLYESGVSVIYREEKVVSIKLGKESEGIYTTTNGARVGVLEVEIKKIYGEIFIQSTPKKYMSYYYDTESEKFLNREERKVTTTMQPPETEKMHIIDLVFDSNGYIESIALADGTAAFFSR